MNSSLKCRIEILHQGSDEWLIWRKNKITATDASIILGASPYKNIFDLWCEKLDMSPPSPMTYAMQRGRDLEDLARDEFCKMTGLWMLPKVVSHIDIEWMGASLDGMDMSQGHMVEIKCNGKKNHSLVLSGKIPDYHIAQVQHQLAVTGLPMAHYFSFDGNKGFVLEVIRDDDFIKNMIEKEKIFWDCLKTFTPPNR